MAVLGLLSLASLPPEHVHLRAHDDDHHQAEVVHRHLAPHLGGPREADLDHDGEVALYLAHAFVAAPPAPEPSPGVAILVSMTDGTSPPLPAAALTRLHRRTHDPPWRAVSLLRGPPSSLA